METWVDRFPGRLEAELADFDDRGLNFRQDEDEFARNGRVVLRGSIEWKGADVELAIRYPDTYPYLRPEVQAPGLSHQRHQNPFQHNLCLLDRSTRSWRISDTGAWLVAERVPHLLCLLEEGGEALTEAEVPQGEPVSAYYPALAGAAIFVPASALLLPKTIRTGSGRLCFQPEAPPQLSLRALVCELVAKDRKRKVRKIAEADKRLRERFGGETISIRWVRLDSPPSGPTPEDVLAAANSAATGFGSPSWQSIRGAEVSVTGVVFEEEVQQGSHEDTWLFAVRVRRAATVQRSEVGAYLVRGERLTLKDTQARIPATAGVENQVVALVGLGALGAEVALEFGKAQLDELRGLDFDVVETGTTVRWPQGLSAVGHPKTDILADRFAADYPFTRFVPIRHQLGGSALDVANRSQSELDVLSRFLEDADLVIDATAEVGVQHLVSDLADQRMLPQVYVSATEGARGGMVARIDPGSTGCWMCLQLHLEDGSVPTPPRERTATVQPRGCASLTFTGAGFDVAPIAMQAVRVAVACLIGQAGPDIFICSLPDDGISPPDWETFDLVSHRQCQRCALENAA